MGGDFFDIEWARVTKAYRRRVLGGAMYMKHQFRV
jgi:hypothetical protein